MLFLKIFSFETFNDTIKDTVFIEDKKKSKNSSQDSAKSIKDILSQVNALKWVQAWKECAGPALLKQAFFYGCEREGWNRVLKLHVPDPLWRQELEFQKDSILKNYQSQLRKLGIEENEIPNRVYLMAKPTVPFKS
jgi:hypothetical protein